MNFHIMYQHIVLTPQHLPEYRASFYGIQVAEAEYRYGPLDLVPHLGETHRQIQSLFLKCSPFWAESNRGPLHYK